VSFLFSVIFFSLKLEFLNREKSKLLKGTLLSDGAIQSQLQALSRNLIAIKMPRQASGLLLTAA
jgi:hypothetical protein